VESIEIERKIILKYVPDIEYDEILNITQYYYKTRKGIWERFRRSEDQSGKVIYTKTIKKNLRIGASLENEIEITEDQYKESKNICESGEFESRVISKIRHVKYVENGLKWEIDDFIDMSLVVCEIEIPYDDYKINYPYYIKDTLIKDVTGWKEFSSRRIAKVLFNKKR